MNRSFLGEIRRLISAAAADFLEDGGDHTPGKREAELHKARVTINAQLGEACVDRLQIEKDIASTRNDLAALADKEHLAVNKGREDLARAVMIQRQALEDRLGQLSTEHAATAAEIDLLERAAATLTATTVSLDGTQRELALDAKRIAAQLAELEGLLRDSSGG